MSGILNRIRYSVPFSRAIRPALRAVDGACGFLRRHLRWDFPINGCTVDYAGVPLVFPTGVGVREYTNALYWEGAGGFEPETAAVLRTLMPHARSFLDIGSNIGVYAVLARRWNPAVALHAFEPVEAIYRRNVRLLEANGLPAAAVHQVACSDRDEERVIHVPLHGQGVEREMTASSLRDDSWQATAANREDQKVRCVRLDSFLQDHPIDAPSVWKIDVEDHEAAVLAGAVASIRRLRPLIVCEILPRDHQNRETLAEIRSLEYEVWAVDHGHLFRVQDGDFAGKRPMRDFLLTPRGFAPAHRSLMMLADLANLMSAWAAST